MSFRLRILRVLSAMLLTLSASLASVSLAQEALPDRYTVQPGDTLSEIALRSGVDAETILRLNDLTEPDLIQTGQTLVLRPVGGGGAATARTAPASAASASTVHVVVEGDTLWSISERYGVSSEAILQANTLEDPNVVVLGSSITIPAAGPTAPRSPVPPAPAEPPAVVDTRPVAPAPQPDVPAMRPLAEQALTPVPALPADARRNQRGIASYTVQPGDTLAQIARQFGVLAGSIAEANQVQDPNVLRVGTVLRVPVPARERVVQPGDTLYSIAADERIDLGALVDFNEIADPSVLRVGEVLVLPAAPAIQSAATLPTPTPEPPKPTPSPTPSPAPSSPPSPSTAAGPTQTPSATPRQSPQPSPSPSASLVPPTPVVPVVTVSAGTASQAATSPLASMALKLLGKPYAWGGSGPSSFDCSGLVWYVAREVKKPVPRGLFAQYNSGPHPARDQLQPGDLVFFQNTYTPGLSHNGIYLGNGEFVHAADERTGVTISSLSSQYWATRWFGAARPA